MTGLGADEEERLVREIGAATAILVRTTNALAALPPVSVDIEAMRLALTQIPVLATRLKARGGLALRTQADHALDTSSRLVADHLAPLLIRLLLTRTPVPGGPPVDGGDPTAIEIAEIYRTVTEWLIKRDPRQPAVSMLKRGHHPLIDQMRAYVEAAEKSMESPDYPDLGAIAANLLRLDVLTWVLVTADFPRDAVDVQAKTRKLARSSMRRATYVMNRCAATFALIDRINLAGTISEIDDLVLIFQRVRQGEREETREGEETFAQSLGAEVIAEFTKAVIELSRSIMDTFIADTLAASDNGGSEIAGMLRALGKLRRLLVGVKDPGIAKSVQQMTVELKSGLTRIGQHIARSMERAIAEKKTADVERLAIMGKAFAGLGEDHDGGA